MVIDSSIDLKRLQLMLFPEYILNIREAIDDIGPQKAATAISSFSIQIQFCLSLIYNQGKNILRVDEIHKLSGSIKL